MEGSRQFVPDRVRDAVEYVVTLGLAHRKLESVGAIGVDEIQSNKGHHYVTLVCQIDPGLTRLFWVGEERTEESFRSFFTVIGDKVASEILFVCSDMWKPYLKVIAEKCSDALHILDRFHIAAKMNKALDEVRAAETRRLVRDGFRRCFPSRAGACSSARRISPPSNRCASAICSATICKRSGRI